MTTGARAPRRTSTSRPCAASSSRFARRTPAADAYAARVDRVEASLRPHRRPDYCLGSSSQAEWRPYKPPADSATPRQRKRPGAGSSPGPHGRGEGVKLTEDGQAALRRQRDLQEGLTDEMVDLAGSIRANATAMERSLRQSRRELDEAETNLEKNLRGVKSANERQTTLKKLNRSGMCWTWIVLVIVGFVFAWTCVRARHERQGAADRIAGREGRERGSRGSGGMS